VNTGRRRDATSSRTCIGLFIFGVSIQPARDFWLLECPHSHFRKVFRIGTVRYNWPMYAHSSHYRFGRLSENGGEGFPVAKNPVPHFLILTLNPNHNPNLHNTLQKNFSKSKKITIAWKWNPRPTQCNLS